MLSNLVALGKTKVVDLHGLTKEEARAEILYELNIVDNFNSIVFVHGYHGGRVLKDLVRQEIAHERIKEKLMLDASQTAYLLKN